MPELDAARGVFGITTAAELSGSDPQSLRLYERRGLLKPARTDGGTRRYSADDLNRVQRIRDLLAAGLNLAGIALVLELQDVNATLRDQSNQPSDLAGLPPRQGGPSPRAARTAKRHQPGH